MSRFSPVFDPLTAGNLMVRLAQNESEIDASQKLRFRIFCGEMGGKGSPEVQAQQRDFDAYDDVCDHLLVMDLDKPKNEQVVGTYRLIRREAAQKVGQFYSESEFDVSKIKAVPGQVLELGRSCVDVDYRNRAVMQLLWRGIGSYVAAYDIEYMFGCASFTGADVNLHKVGLSYLYHQHLAPEHMRPRALPHLYVDMNIIPKDQLNLKEALMDLPPLIKGYLRVGGYIGDGAMLDYAYNTTDVGIVVEVASVTEKYFQRMHPDPSSR